MKTLFYILFITIILSCNSQKNINQEAILKTTKSKCPEDGVCSFEVLKNKTFSIQSKFGDTYPEFSNSNKTVLKFEYVRNLIPDTQDSGYRELIYVEIDSNLEALELENETLNKAKVSYGRLCFCRGQTGYYPINIGNLKLIKIKNGMYQLNLEFKTNEVPQVITSINETFKL